MHFRKKDIAEMERRCRLANLQTFFRITFGWTARSGEVHKIKIRLEVKRSIELSPFPVSELSQNMLFGLLVSCRVTLNPHLNPTPLKDIDFLPSEVPILISPVSI